MANVNALLDSAGAFLVRFGLITATCANEFFVKHNFLQAECLKATASKGLGLAIVAGSSLVKVPQILKIWASGSAEGLSFLGILLELLAVTANGAYSYNHGFPFSSYGEAVFLSLQTSLIAMLVLWFGGQTLTSLVFTIIYGSVIFAIVQPGVVPPEALWWGQAANIPMIVVGKSIQAWANFRNGHTGQLSPVTIFLIAFGSLVRIFTSIQETGDNIVILTYICSSTINVVLAFQMIYYWNATKVALSKAGGAGKKQKQKRA